MMWRKKGRWTSYESISRRYVLDDDCTTTTTQSTATKAATRAKTPLQSWRWSWSRSVSRGRCVLDDDCTTTTTSQIPLTTRSKAAATAKTIGGPSFKPLESLRWSWSRRVLSMSSALRRMSTIRRATEEEAQEFCVLKLTLRTFSLSELKRATRNFSRDNVVGRGGFAKVYCGSLPGGQLVAVKRLMAGEGRDTLEGFLAELGHVVNVSHPNIARLVGVGVDGGEYLLVFPFSRLGCLSGKLHGGSGAAMPWAARYRVALGTARGLEYLHERCARRIVHRDIKPANILLMDNYEPLICDFGLARWLPAQLTHLQVSVFEGTFGYVPPEYTTHGVFSEKTDVFAFGVVLLELLTGRRAVNAANKLSLVSWARPFLDDDDEVLKMVDPALGGEYNDEQLRDVAWAANLCVNASPDHRPRMSEVLKILQGAGSSRRQARNQLHGDDYDAVRYADDLSRHKKLAFDFDAE